MSILHMTLLYSVLHSDTSLYLPHQKHAVWFHQKMQPRNREKECNDLNDFFVTYHVAISHKSTHTNSSM